MSKQFKSVTGNLYSVHWENDREHGYFHSTIRILAKDAADAITSTRPKTAGKIHVKSVDMLAEGLTVLLSNGILDTSYGGKGSFSDADYREMLGTTETEHHHAYTK